MKSLGKILVLIILCLTVAIAFVACGEEACQHRDANDDDLCDKCGKSYTDGKDTADEHVHSYGEWKTTKTATCAEDGIKERYCSCGDKQSSTLSKTGHSYGEWETTKAATCAEDGIKERYCSCGDKQSSTIPKTSHSFGELKLYNDGETDCEKKLYFRICSGCSDIAWIDGKYDDHIWSTVTTAPTCIAGGYDTKTCNTCGKVEICNQTEKIPHTYNEFYSSNTTHHWIECKVCKTKKSEGAHVIGDQNVCMVCDPSAQPTAGILYDLSADKTYYEVIGYEGTATKIRIAETYNGLPVKTIYKESFSENRKITSIIIPDSITSIGYRAFYRCDGLTSVTIGEGVTSIGVYAFFNCRSLASITIGNSVASISDDAFYGCSSLKAVYISDVAAWCNIDFYGYDSNPLYYAKNLYLNGELVTNLTIPDSVTSIGYCAFYNCSSLESITIPDSVTSIGSYAFYGCTKLIKEYNYCSYVGDASNPYKVLIGVTTQNLSAYEIHSNTRIIAGSAFYGCSRLASIIIPDSVIYIGISAFSYCSSLTSINYSGTMAEWKAISKGSNWNYNTGNFTVYCSDGNISKSEA